MTKTSVFSTTGSGDNENRKSTQLQLGDLTLFETRFGGKYSIGKTIAREGPGDGYASYPWALDPYERDLGLSPGESWLLKRMIKHAWSFGDPVFISLRKVAREAMISTSTLSKIVKSLKDKGFIRVVNRGEGYDRRVRYDIAGLYFALAFSIQANHQSKTCKRSGKILNLLDLFPDETQGLFKDDIWKGERVTVRQLNYLANRKGHWIDWCTREIQSLPDGPPPEKKLTTDEVKERIHGAYVDDDFDV